MLKLLRLAAQVAVPRGDPRRDHRAFWLGAVGVRGDGVVVSARNGSVQMSETIGGGWSYPQAHAEYRCTRKMDHGGTVYVARVRPDGSLALARPCPDCVKALLSRRVSRCFYTVSDAEYGVLDLRGDERVVKLRAKK